MVHAAEFSVGNEGRQVFWNAESFEPFLFLLSALVLVFFIYSLYRRWRLWTALGGPERRTEGLGRRLKLLILNGLLQAKTFAEPYPGVMHGLVFFGFVVLFFGAVFDATEFHLAEPLGWPFLRGRFYLVFSFLMELFGLAVLAGVGLAAWRRYVRRPERLAYRGASDNTPDDGLVLILIAAIIVTGFIVEALRLAVTSPAWEVWSFGGWFLAGAFGGLSPEAARALHKFFWWFHAALSLLFIAYIPFSRLVHMIATPANHFMASLGPAGALKPIRDFETAETFGVGRIGEFTKKQLFDAEACTRCGRCQDGCPAYLSGKPLSPKKLIQDLKTAWLPEALAALEAKRQGPEEGLLRRALAGLGGVIDPLLAGGRRNAAPSEAALVGTAVDPHELWACTTCLYCQEHCSAAVEHVPKVIDLRRYKVLTEADFAPELQLTFRNMENNSNPWGIGSHLRADWAKDLGIKTLAEDPDVEYLFFVGCAGSFDDRGKKVAEAFAGIMQKAGVSFGILGTQEGCCGDSALRAGNEYLYQGLAQANIEVMKGYNVRKIVTICPHGYQVLKNDYPLLGGDFEVYHHSQLIASLISQKRIVPKTALEGLAVYHDSCYLGRYNGLYEEPRRILAALPGLKLTEMERSRAKSFCCGAGGARMWLEETTGERINDLRTDQALATGADLIAAACPFCLTMLTDGVKDRGRQDSVAVLDIAELVLPRL